MHRLQACAKILWVTDEWLASLWHAYSSSHPSVSVVCVGGPGKMVIAASVWILGDLILVAVGGTPLAGSVTTILSLVHTGDKVEFNTVDFGESRLLPKPATKSTVADTVDFVAGFGNKLATTWIWQLVAVDFVASVYGVKATRWTLSTFHKVDRVEFNFVASVYWTLLV